MPTTVTSRARSRALSRKNFLEAAILDESEIVVEKRKPEPMVQSPTSILAPPPHETMTPMQLPDAWMVVGKRGKPVKQPLPAKKRRTRTRRSAAAKNDTPLQIMTDGPLPSKCVALHVARIDRLQKGKERSLLFKHWLKRRRKREAAVAARDAHVELLETGEEAGYRDSRHKKPQRSRDKERRQAARRQARLLAAEARCFSPVA